MSYEELCTYGTPIEYLESTGKQWIDTGVTLGEGLNFRVKYSENNTDYGCVFGGEFTASNPRILLTNKNYAYGTVSHTYDSYRFGEAELAPTRFVINRNISYNSTYKPILDFSIRIALFGLYVNNANTRLRTPMRIHWFECIGKVYLHPLIDPQGRPCMFDVISKQYFYNQGSFEFIAGGVITRPKLSPQWFLHYEDAMIRERGVNLVDGASTGEWENIHPNPKWEGENTYSIGLRTADNENYIYSSILPILKVGVDYVLSFETKRTRASPRNHVYILSGRYSVNGAIISKTIPHTAEWVRHEIVWRFGSNFEGVDDVRIRFDIDDNGSQTYEQTLFLRNVMLEEGSTPHPWRPSLNDQRNKQQ